MPTWPYARCRLGSIAVLALLVLVVVREVRADAPATVIWLGGDGGDQASRERALRLELEARAITLLHLELEATPPQAQAGDAPASREALARDTLARTQVDAVLWLEGDPTRQVSWLRMVHRRGDSLEQAPLPHPPEAITAELFAVAGASLIAQVLGEPASAPVAAPIAEPPPTAPAQPDRALDPKQVARAGLTVQPAASAQPRTANKPQRAPAHEPPGPWFVQGGVALSLVDVHSRMEAATRPTTDQIFLTQGDRFFFDDTSPWVPDKDSFDDYEQFATDDMGNIETDPRTGEPVVLIERGRTPVPGDCPADGIVTGPAGVKDVRGEPFSQVEPSKYCARVEEPGVAFEPALRIVLGRWLLPQLALGVVYQGHFGIDADSFLGNQLFGAQAEYLALGARGRGLTFSLLGELDIGRTESTVPGPSNDRPRVNALSGPFGAQGGAQLRVWIASNIALLANVTVGVRFPATQGVLEPAAGCEIAF